MDTDPFPGLPKKNIFDRTFVLRHVDELESSLRGRQGSLDDGGGVPDKGEDGAIGRRARIDVQQFDPVDISDGVRDGLNYLQ